MFSVVKTVVVVWDKLGHCQMDSLTKRAKIFQNVFGPSVQLKRSSLTIESCIVMNEQSPMLTEEGHEALSLPHVAADGLTEQSAAFFEIAFLPSNQKSKRKF